MSDTGKIRGSSGVSVLKMSGAISGSGKNGGATLFQQRKHHVCAEDRCGHEIVRETTQKGLRN